MIIDVIGGESLDDFGVKQSAVGDGLLEREII